MAKIFHELKQNQNDKAKIYGKWFAYVKNVETLNTRKLATHISEHGSIYTPDVVYGVLEKFRSCLLEMLLNSKRVKIEGLGTFYTTLECTKGGALTADKFNVNKHVKGLHIRFLPDQGDEVGLNSKTVLAKATFMWAEDLKREAAETKPVTPSSGGSETPSNPPSNGNQTPTDGD